MSVPTPAPLEVPPATTQEKILRYAKAHVAVIGAIVAVLLNYFADTSFVHTYGTLIVGLLTAAGVAVTPNAPSQQDKAIAASALAVQAQNPPETEVDTSAPLAPAGLEDLPADQPAGDTKADAAGVSTKAP